MDYIALIKRIIKKGKYDAKKLKDQINVLYLDENTGIDSSVRDELINMINSGASGEDILALIEAKIAESKKSVETLLAGTTLRSTCKYEEGREYSITQDKLVMLASKIAIGQACQALGKDVVLMWNATGEPMEEYSLEELVQLGIEIMDHTDGIVLEQQEIEVELKGSTTKNELDKVKPGVTGKKPKPGPKPKEEKPKPDPKPDPKPEEEKPEEEKPKEEKPKEEKPKEEKPKPDPKPKEEEEKPEDEVTKPEDENPKPKPGPKSAE